TALAGTYKPSGVRLCRLPFRSNDMVPGQSARDADGHRRKPKPNGTPKPEGCADAARYQSSAAARITFREKGEGTVRSRSQNLYLASRHGHRTYRGDFHSVGCGKGPE